MLRRIWQYLTAKSGPPLSTGGGSNTGFVDLYRQCRAPTPRELIDELKGTAWSCATLNASACASHPPRLYVRTDQGQTAPRCLTRQLSRTELWAFTQPKPGSPLPRALSGMSGSGTIEEVLEHPLLTLLSQVNSEQNAFDLWEQTTLYQEVIGSAYWRLDQGLFGPPDSIWILPSQNVTPYRATGSPNVVDGYIYRSGNYEQKLLPEEVIHFCYPDPRNPYSGRGLSPLRACYEQVTLTSEFASFKNQKFRNHALPDAIISPDEVIGEEERDRFEALWRQKFRAPGAGRVVVGESKLNVSLLAHSMGDLAALADQKATKEDIANAFGVPIAYFSTHSNLANLQASESQHAKTAVRPRLHRRDEKLNERLVPLFDPSGRLFLWSDDPVPDDRTFGLAQEAQDLKLGVRTINEVRATRGLPPVVWGDVPYTPAQVQRIETDDLDQAPPQIKPGAAI